MPQDAAKAKSSLFSKLPRISPVSRIILFIGIFLIVAIPLYLVYSQQQARQAELAQQYSMLEKALGKPESSEVLKKGLESDLKIAQNELDAIKTTFPNPDQVPEIIDRLIELAKLNGIEITKTQVATSIDTINIGADILEYPVVVFNVNLRGQVSKFQNFLLALNNKFPTCELKKVSFVIPVSEKEEHTANIVLHIFSSKVRTPASIEIPITGKKPVIIFSDKKDLTTAVFKIKGSKWRVDWKATATNSKWSGFNIMVYRKGETLRYIDIFAHSVGRPDGTDYVYDGEGDYYLKVLTSNISNWEIKIYE